MLVGVGNRKESWNIKLGKGKFIDLKILSQDEGFNILARTLSDGANVLLGGLL